MQFSNAIAIVRNQNAEWDRMKAEESQRQNLLRYGIMMLIVAYALLFVLTAVFSTVASLFVPFSAVHAVTSVVVQFALAIASLYFVPQILAAIAPSFGGQNDALNALKLYVFAMTPAWIGQTVGVIPLLGWLAALAGGIYAIYLFWQHISDALSVPADKKIGYVIVSVLVLVVVFFVIGAIGEGIAAIVSPYSVIHHGIY
ncbi:MAG TPA: Yip1 family protein [Candidatus Kapabacteria bacterium]